MRIELLCTGDEILTGKTVNTNYSHMARRLGEAGLTVSWGTTVGDNRDQLLSAFHQASGRADAVIVNGGLGPTVDDLSQEVAAVAAGVELELNEGWLERIQHYYTRRGRLMPPTNQKQAMLPQGAVVIDNPVGTACGFYMTINGACFFFTPGVPREMKRMIDEQVIPKLLEMCGSKVLTRLKRFHTFGIGESRADLILAGIEDIGPGGSVKLGFQSHYPQLETKLAVQATSVEDLRRKLAPVEDAVRQRLGNFIIAEDDQTLEGRVLDALRKARGTLSTIEMFTGGSITARLLHAESGGDIVKLGVASRDLTQLVDAAGLGTQYTGTGVSCATAVALANGLRGRTGSTHALVVMVSLDADRETESGGDIHIGMANGAASIARHARMLGSRTWIRLGAIEMGLDCLRRQLYGLPVEQRIDFEVH